MCELVRSEEEESNPHLQPPSDVCSAMSDDWLTLDGTEVAYSRGEREGTEEGRARAVRDGSILGRKHGAAFGGELGGLEGFSLVLSALVTPPTGCPAPGKKLERVARAAAHLQTMISELPTLTSGAPLPERVDVMETIKDCRAKAKLCCSGLDLPAAAADLSGWKVGEAGGEVKGAKSKETLDF